MGSITEGLHDLERFGLSTYNNDCVQNASIENQEIKVNFVKYLMCLK